MNESIIHIGLIKADDLDAVVGIDGKALEAVDGR
jgi:hypothetical protein